jgi:hypothetical protein
MSTPSTGNSHKAAGHSLPRRFVNRSASFRLVWPTSAYASPKSRLRWDPERGDEPYAGHAGQKSDYGKPGIGFGLWRCADHSRDTQSTKTTCPSSRLLIQVTLDLSRDRRWNSRLQRLHFLTVCRWQDCLTVPRGGGHQHRAINSGVKGGGSLPSTAG